jgi:hypothetical protein
VKGRSITLVVVKLLSLELFGGLFSCVHLFHIFVIVRCLVILIIVLLTDTAQAFDSRFSFWHLAECLPHFFHTKIAQGLILPINHFIFHILFLLLLLNQTT